MVKCHTLSNITKLDDLILESYPSREARGLCCPYSYHRKPSTVYYTPLPMSSQKSTQAGCEQYPQAPRAPWRLTEEKFERLYDTIGVNTPDKTGVLLLAGEQGSHLLVTDSGDTAITLDSSTEGNHVTVYDRYQNPRVHLASDKNVDGVVVLDKAGNVRGSIP